jgi:malonyl-CoA decarboxylase
MNCLDYTIEVALVDSLEPNVQKIIQNDERDAIPASKFTSAIFYSISSTQPGLSGVELGNL